MSSIADRNKSATRPFYNCITESDRCTVNCRHSCHNLPSVLFLHVVSIFVPEVGPKESDVAGNILSGSWSDCRISYSCIVSLIVVTATGDIKQMQVHNYSADY